MVTTMWISNISGSLAQSDVDNTALMVIVIAQRDILWKKYQNNWSLLSSYDRKVHVVWADKKPVHIIWVLVTNYQSATEAADDMIKHRA
jgi:hypothetical protein